MTSRSLPLITFTAACLVGSATAQCALDVTPIGRTPDADGTVHTTCHWDPDGVGPGSAVVVFGGAFRSLGNATCAGIATFDPATGECGALGTGITAPALAEIVALAVLPTNELIAAGSFTAIDGNAATNVARWNGTAWQPMGSGVAMRVMALAVLPNGDLVAGGMGSGPRVTRWNGTGWTALGNLPGGGVTTLATMPNGILVAGGDQLLPATNLVAWNGTTWSVFAGGTTGMPYTSRLLPNGDLLVAGAITAAGGSPIQGIARWNGSTWSGLGVDCPESVGALCSLPNGDIVAGGNFLLAGGQTVNQVARWNGSVWSAMGNGLGEPSPMGYSGPVRTVFALANGEVIGGGSFTTPAGDADYVARWNGSAWTQLRNGTGGVVRATAAAANGDLFVGGDFTTIEGVAAARIARRSNGAWLPLGTGANGAVHALLPLPNGDLVIGGAFTAVGGIAAQRVARWDGNNWHAIGGGLPGVVHDLAPGPGSQILAAGSFTDQIAVWDGLAWHGTGVAQNGLPSSSTLLAQPGGSVLCSLNGAVHRWDGTNWLAIIGSAQPAMALAVGPTGDIYVAHGSTNSGLVRRWSAGMWLNLGGSSNGEITELLALPNGDLLAAGGFTTIGGVAAKRLARWSGSTWAEVVAGTDGTIHDLRWSATGRVFVGGAFRTLGAVSCGSIGELTTPCPAVASAAGAGCSGSGGVNLLASTSLPWLGATFASTATGMPSGGIAVEVLGFGALAQPLATLLPVGVAGCVLSTTPDHLVLHAPLAAALELGVPLPNGASLVGIVVRQQVVPFELDLGGSITAVTATNSLQLTLGQF